MVTRKNKGLIAASAGIGSVFLLLAILLGSLTGGETLFTVVFVVLKALGFISWSWWWVFSPLWIGALVDVTVFVLTLIVFGFGALIVKLADNKGKPSSPVRRY